MTKSGSTDPADYRPEVLQAMRDDLADQDWGDVTAESFADRELITDAEVVRAVHALHEGGVKEWLDSELLAPEDYKPGAGRREELEAQLAADDRAEAAGMHADDRLTCHPCKSWADHAHDLFTGRRMSLEAWDQAWGRAQPAAAEPAGEWLSNVLPGAGAPLDGFHEHSALGRADDDGHGS
jgi:hypothetical protein